MSSEELSPEESAELAVDGIVRTDHAVYVESSTNPDDLPVGDWLNIQRLHQQGDENGLLKAAREIRRTAREQGRAEGEAEWAAAVEGLAFIVCPDLTHTHNEGHDECEALTTTITATLLTADRTKALDAVKAQAAREAGERIAQAIEADVYRQRRTGGGIYTADFAAGTQHAARIARADRNPNGGDS